MSSKNICIVHGHPDASKPHLCDALGGAYAEGATEAGHHVSEIRVGELEFGYMRSAAEYTSTPPHDIAEEREKIAAADHVVFVFPLWMGGMPALFHGFMEHCARDGFMLEESDGPKEWPKRMMKGKSARLVVTMGMPASFYRLFYRAHGIRAIERNLLGISGFKPVRRTFYGAVEAVDDARRRRWLEEMRQLGARAE